MTIFALPSRPFPFSSIDPNKVVCDRERECASELLRATNVEFDVDRLFSCLGLNPGDFLGLSGTKSTSFFSIIIDRRWGNFAADEKGGDTGAWRYCVFPGVAARFTGDLGRG